MVDGETVEEGTAEVVGCRVASVATGDPLTEAVDDLVVVGVSGSVEAAAVRVAVAVVCSRGGGTNGSTEIVAEGVLAADSDGGRDARADEEMRAERVCVRDGAELSDTDADGADESDGFGDCELETDGLTV